MWVCRPNVATPSNDLGMIAKEPPSALVCVPQPFDRVSAYGATRGYRFLDALPRKPVNGRPTFLVTMRGTTLTIGP